MQHGNALLLAAQRARRGLSAASAPAFWPARATAPANTRNRAKKRAAPEGAASHPHHKDISGGVSALDAIEPGKLIIHVHQGAGRPVLGAKTPPRPAETVGVSIKDELAQGQQDGLVQLDRDQLAGKPQHMSIATDRPEGPAAGRDRAGWHVAAHPWQRGRGRRAARC